MQKIVTLKVKKILRQMSTQLEKARNAFWGMNIDQSRDDKTVFI